MKTIIETLTIILLLSILLTTGKYIYNYENQDKQHIKLIRKGCHQYRLNEYTDEVVHFEGCDDKSHDWN